MYLIQYVKYDYDYESYDQRDEHIELGCVSTEELAKEICGTYCINLEYHKVNSYDSTEEFFKDHVMWGNTVYFSINLSKEEVKIDFNSYPDFKDDVYRNSHYQVFTNKRNIIDINITFNTDNEVTEFKQDDALNYFIKHLFKSGEKNKKKIAEVLLQYFTLAINKQFDKNFKLPKEKVTEFGYFE